MVWGEQRDFFGILLKVTLWVRKNRMNFFGHFNSVLLRIWAELHDFMAFYAHLFTGFMLLGAPDSINQGATNAGHISFFGAGSPVAVKDIMI